MADVPNWKLVSPQSKKKLGGILKWARRTPHPHAECTRALMKRGVPRSQAVKVCAVMKDMAFHSTKWRKGGK